MAYAHPVFSFSSPLHYFTAAVFAAIALLLLIGGAIEIVQIFRARGARRRP
jgi:hypothetical protein